MRQASADKTAGWLLAGLGAVHTVVTPFLTRRTWAEVAGEGWWDTFTIATATTRDELQRSEAFWSSVGSCGVPAGALGGFLVWSSRRDQQVPAWLGWGLLAHGTLLSILLPRSPIWIVPVAGLLLVVSNVRRGDDPFVEKRLDGSDRFRRSVEPTRGG